MTMDPDGKSSVVNPGDSNDDAEMQDLFVDDLDAIFADDPPSDEFALESGVADNVPIPVPSDSGSNRRRRSGSRFEKGDRGIPPPSWHSEAADKAHRQSMILDM